MLQICYTLTGMSDASVSGETLPSSPGGQPDRPAPGLGLYGISVAAELVGSAPQNLRLYEARGLIHPARSNGGTRRYSDDDLVRLRLIGRLLDDGLNLAGIAAVLALQVANQALQIELDDSRQKLTTLRPRRQIVP